MEDSGEFEDAFNDETFGVDISALGKLIIK